MFRLGGMRKLTNSCNGGIVRFYVRDAGGRFSSTKITFMPKNIQNDINLLGGEMLFANFRGFIVNVKKPQLLNLSSINFQTVKVVV